MHIYMTCCDINNAMLVEAQKNVHTDEISFLQCDANIMNLQKNMI